MGAGAVKAEGQQRQSQGRTQGQGQGSKSLMACDGCAVNFSIFKRKFACADCHKHYCSSCMPKQPSQKVRVCGKCRMLSSGNFTRQDLMKFYNVKDLRLFLQRNQIATQQCTEKNDLVDLILRHSNNSTFFREQEEHRRHVENIQQKQREEERNAREQQRASPNPSSNSRQADAAPAQPDPQAAPAPPEPMDWETSAPPPRQEQTASTSDTGGETLQQRQAREMRETEERLRQELNDDEAPDPRPARVRAKIENVKELGDIDDLSVRQLKEILAGNFVDFKGCVERSELVERVRRLWKDKQQSATTEGDGSAENENDLCKICMDAKIDCVLLECGHMITCTQCGRRLAECPICRQNIVRVVHTFRA